MEEKKTIEVKYEIQLGQLLGIALLAVGIAIVLGFWVGNEYGYTKGFSQVDVVKPPYCTADTSAGIVTVKCNELGNVSMKDFCSWASPELKEKVKLVLIND